MNHPDTLVLHGDTVTDTTSAAPLTPPAPGDLWPAMGGRYDGILRGDDGKAYDQVSALVEDGGDFTNVEWGKYGTEIPGAASDRDGLANTDAMAAAGLQIAIDVRALRIAGFDDWHIPARHQARLAFINCGEYFDQDDCYWTSTQCSAHGAWGQYFASGNQDDWGKDGTGRVRAVRRFSVIQ